MAEREKATWRDPALGVPRELDLPQGGVRYFEAGTGSPIVFVHGLLVNANLWRKVIAPLSPEFRCLALDLRLGSHTLPMPPAADLTPHGLADLIADVLEALALEDVTLVGNDTGGALCQNPATRPVNGVLPGSVIWARSPFSTSPCSEGSRFTWTCSVSDVAFRTGGFAVEVVRADERRELVAVKLGLFDTGGGRVQVEGDLRAGDAVVVPSI